MKNFFKILLLVLLLPLEVAAQTVAVPDDNFLTYLKTNFPQVIDANDALIITEAAKVTGSINCYNHNISSLEGIQYFTGIQFIYAGNNLIANLPDISALSNLEVLNVSENHLTALPALNTLTKLRKLFIYTNQLQAIPDISNCSLLTDLVAYNNQLQTLPDLSLPNLLFLEVGGNQLTVLPNLNGVPVLEKLLAWSNKITALPDLSPLQNLKVLNIGANELTVTPDLSGNTLIEEVIFNHNYLTIAPDLSGHTALKHVILEHNYLSFEDLIPFTSNPAFSSIFSVSPQRIFKIAESKNIKENESLILSTAIDQNITGITYVWYKGISQIQSSSEDTLQIQPVTLSDSGLYYCIIQHPSLPNLQLHTDTFNIQVYPCLDISTLTLTRNGIDCIKTGELQVDTTSVSAQDLIYRLESSTTGKSFASEAGAFKGLSEPEYTLTIEASPSCIKTYGTVKIPVDPCEDIYITPDNDGEKDSYFISATGTAIIYDKNGNRVKTLTLPSDWDGYGKSGKVPPGYYLVEINDGEDFLNITVIY